MKIINESKTFKINKKFDAECVNLSGCNILVVDNFYENPNMVRDLILNIPRTKFYPNTETHISSDSSISISYDMRVFTETFTNLIAKFFPKAGESFNHNYIESMLHDHPFVVNVVQSKDRRILPKSLSGNGFFIEICLNIEDEYSWGTSFYDNTDKCVGVIPMEFNRMLLYDNHILHNAYMENDSFVDDNYRITQYFFLNTSWRE
tara:strand:- start:631 stop:1245 length:615 start_codon:yes stop_codon:yes gene_type:complete